MSYKLRRKNTVVDMDWLFSQCMPEPNTGCWLWINAVNKHGYAIFTYQKRHLGLHRFSWELANQAEIPAGMMICHRCDQRSCINPDHLFLGTAKDNMADAQSKLRLKNYTGRKMHGENSYTSKLRDEEVLFIRSAAKGGSPRKDLAFIFDVTVSNIDCIVNRVSWRHLATQI